LGYPVPSFTKKKKSGTTFVGQAKEGCRGKKGGRAKKKKKKVLSAFMVGAREAQRRKTPRLYVGGVRRVAKKI